jgi:hypothetical protein
LLSFPLFLTALSHYTKLQPAWALCRYWVMGLTGPVTTKLMLHYFKCNFWAGLPSLLFPRARAASRAIEQFLAANDLEQYKETTDTLPSAAFFGV